MAVFIAESKLMVGSHALRRASDSAQYWTAKARAVSKSVPVLRDDQGVAYRFVEDSKQNFWKVSLGTCSAVQVAPPAGIQFVSFNS